MTLSERVATLSGLGRAPIAPGTVASLAALVLAWPLGLAGGRAGILICGILAGAVGAWACELYAREISQSDPPECVVDELAGQWIACAFAPFSFAGFVVAFLLFRFFDIVKPWPISRLERLHGGIGIMADDLGAGVAAGIVLAVLAHLSFI